MALYQQGTQKIEVIIKKEAGGANTAGANETDVDEVVGGGNAEQQESAESIKKGFSKKFWRVNISHTMAVGHQVFDLGVNYKLTGLGMETGDMAYQEQIQGKVEYLQDGSNIATAIGMGALYGSAGGPLGALIGATLGGISSGVSTFVKYKNKGRQYDFEVFKQENSIEYQRARANINWTTGRLR